MMEPYVRILRGLREEKGTSQVEVAKQLGVAQQYYSKYENGEYEMPVRHLITLANYYGVSLDYIAGRTKSRKSVEALNVAVTAQYTGGELLSDVLALGEAGRAATVEFIQFQKEKRD